MSSPAVRPRMERAKVRTANGWTDVKAVRVSRTFLVHRPLIVADGETKQDCGRDAGWTVSHGPTGMMIAPGVNRTLGLIVERVQAWADLADARDPGFLERAEQADPGRAARALRPHMALLSRLVIDKAADLLSAPLPGMVRA